MAQAQAGDGSGVPRPSLPPQKQSQAQEQPTQKVFFNTCHLCDWKSSEDTNASSIPYFNEQLKLHMAFIHKLSADPAGAVQVDVAEPGQVQEQREYELASEDRMFARPLTMVCRSSTRLGTLGDLSTSRTVRRACRRS